MSSEKYEKISESLTNQLKCTNLKKYSEFCDKKLIPTILSFLTNTVDQAVWQSFTYKILLQTRSGNCEIRVQAFSCVNRALSTIGKEFAALIGDIMPFVLEGLEDNEDSVTFVAKSLLAQLQGFCGEEINNYLA